jgi:hypothetical protein
MLEGYHIIKALFSIKIIVFHFHDKCINIYTGSPLAFFESFLLFNNSIQVKGGGGGEMVCLYLYLNEHLYLQ